MKNQSVLTDVPDDQVDSVVADFESEGAKVQRTRQKNGKWTVTAYFPDTTESDTLKQW